MLKLLTYVDMCPFCSSLLLEYGARGTKVEGVRLSGQLIEQPIYNGQIRCTVCGCDIDNPVLVALCKAHNSKKLYAIGKRIPEEILIYDVPYKIQGSEIIFTPDPILIATIEANEITDGLYRALFSGDISSKDAAFDSLLSIVYAAR
jgi:hypothetical protein